MCAKQQMIQLDDVRQIASNDSDDRQITSYNFNEDIKVTLAALGKALVALSERYDADKQENSQAIDSVRQENSRAISSVRQEVMDMKTDFASEIEGIKDNQYLEDWQCKTALKAMRSRVGWILHNHCNETGEDYDEVSERYFGKFMQALHHDAKDAGYEGGKMTYTLKRNYPGLLDFAGEWYPSEGVKGKMRYFDKKAGIRKRLKESMEE